MRWKNMLVFKSKAIVKAFKMKLHLFKNQLAKAGMSHFITCWQAIPLEYHLMVGEKYKKHILLLGDEFDKRMQLSNKDQVCKSDWRGCICWFADWNYWSPVFWKL